MKLLCVVAKVFLVLGTLSAPSFVNAAGTWVPNQSVSSYFIPCSGISPSASAYLECIEEAAYTNYRDTGGTDCPDITDPHKFVAAAVINGPSLRSGTDAAGNQLTQTNANSVTVEYAYDELNRLTGLT